MPTLEICAGSLTSAIAAIRGGAHRLELCHNLESGGTTPSLGLITKVQQALLSVSPTDRIPIHVLIRPRPGDFVYTDDEVEVMVEDIRVCRNLKCAGVVVGVLTPDPTRRERRMRVDVDKLTKLVAAARPMQVTFHRAFDDLIATATVAEGGDGDEEAEAALEDIISVGCERVLTSGGAASAVQGQEVLARLVRRAGDRIVVMPGAGITSGNSMGLIEGTGAREVHASGKRVVGGNGREVEVEVERRSWFFADERWETDVDEVRALVRIVSDGGSDRDVVS